MALYDQFLSRKAISLNKLIRLKNMESGWNAF